MRFARIPYLAHFGPKNLNSSNYTPINSAYNNVLFVLPGSSDSIKAILCNPHLCHLLLEIHESRDPQLLVQKAMNIPVFVEFADECLQICGFHDEQK